MLIVPNQTYNGKHGLFLAGHPVNLPEHLIGQIDADLAMRNPPQKFDYRVVDNPEEINTPILRVRIDADKRPRKGVFKPGQEIRITRAKLEVVVAEAEQAEADFKYTVLDDKPVKLETPDEDDDPSVIRIRITKKHDGKTMKFTAGQVVEIPPAELDPFKKAAADEKVKYEILD